MKSKITILVISMLMFNQLYAQDQRDVIFNVKDNSFEKSNPKKVDKEDKIIVHLKHFNPFAYTRNISIKSEDSSDKVFPFLLGIFGNYFGTVVQNLRFSGVPASDNYNKFVTAYNDHIELISYVKNHYFDYNEVAKANAVQIKYLDSISLFQLYAKLSSSERKAHPEITLTKVLELQNINKAILDYYEKMVKADGLLKVGQYKAKGTKIVIQIELNPRAEALSFGFPKDKIIGKTKIAVNNTFGLTFSSGLFASLHVEPDYFIGPESGGFVIRNEDRGNIMPGVNSLAHLSMSNWDSFSIVLGGGVTIDAIPHFLVGGSFQLFDSKVHLNAGYGWAFGKTLSDGLETGTVYTTSPTLKTKKKLLGNVWFGLSYKL